MMNNWLLLDENAEIEGYHSLDLPNKQTNDWVQSEFDSNDEVTGLVVPLPISNLMQKKIVTISLHIRLSPDVLHERAFIPMVFVPDDGSSLVDVAKNLGALGSFLLTEGVYFAGSFEEVEKGKKNYSGLTYNNQSYKTFLNTIHVNKHDFTGNHSIANQWGAFRMAEAAGLSQQLLPENVRESTSTLYFKYLKAVNYRVKKKKAPNLKSKRSLKGPKIIGKVNLNEKYKIQIGTKQVLLIDDEADKGWKEVLGEIFDLEHKGQFHVISESVSNYNELNDSSKKLIESGDIDLFLVDLRLKGDHEKNLNTSELSGAKIAKKIKTLNKGNQVIVFTASNKAWNMKELLFMQDDGYDIGVDGYYIKESPLSGFAKDESVKSLHDLGDAIKESLNVSYLRDIYNTHSKLIRKSAQLAKNTTSSNLKQFYIRTIKNLRIAFSLIMGSKNNPINLNFAFLQYYQILEDYVSLNVVYKYIDGNEYVYKDGKWICVISNSRGSQSGDRGWKLEYNKSTEYNFSYFKRLNDTEYIFSNSDSKGLSKISFVLAFRHDCDNDQLEEFGYLNTQRNSIAHNENDFIDDHIDADEIQDVMKYVNICLD